MPNDLPNDSWHNPTSPAGKAWVKTWRSIYHPLGFKKGYNFPLFVILVGALMGFSLSRMMFYNIDGIFIHTTVPSDAMHYLGGHRRVGIIIHLVGVLPAAFLVCFQFVPIIRYKALIFHRINGYVVSTLFLVGNAGAFMILHTSAGGSLATQFSLGVLGTLTTIALILAIYNVKRKQIDQHRAWMLRLWVYASVIISLRLMILASNSAIERYGIVYWSSHTCAEIFKMYKLVGVPDVGNPTSKIYPQCTSPTSQTRVLINNQGSGPESRSVNIENTFGALLWLMLVLHASAVEIYLKLTPAESERLRQVSYEKQLEAGFKNPGRAGLTPDRLGDAPTWKPKSVKVEEDRQKAKIASRSGSETEVE